MQFNTQAFLLICPRRRERLTPDGRDITIRLFLHLNSVRTSRSLPELFLFIKEEAHVHLSDDIHVMLLVNKQ